MDRLVKFYFDNQVIEIYVDDIPEDATISEIRDMALDIFELNCDYEIWEAQMERIVRIWIGNDYLEYEIEDNGDWTEDELYEAVLEDVYNTISLEIL